MNRLLFLTLVALATNLSFGQDYRQIFERSLEDNTKELLEMGFVGTNSFPNYDNLTRSYNFETYKEKGHFENRILIYDINGVLIQYSILTSNADFYDMYLVKYSNKKPLGNSDSYDFVFEDEQNLFAFASKTIDEITFYSIEVHALSAEDK